MAWNIIILDCLICINFGIVGWILGWILYPEQDNTSRLLVLASLRLNQLGRAVGLLYIRLVK